MILIVRASVGNTISLIEWYNDHNEDNDYHKRSNGDSSRHNDDDDGVDVNVYDGDADDYEYDYGRDNDNDNDNENDINHCINNNKK